jgi:hypothetical protein
MEKLQEEPIFYEVQEKFAILHGLKEEFQRNLLIHFNS